MTVETLHAATADAAAEPAAGPIRSEPATDADGIWIAAALDWDELEGGRNISLLPPRGKPPLVGSSR